MVDQAKKDEMLAVLIRNNDAFLTFQHVFEVKHAHHMLTAVHAVVWQTVLALYEADEELPDKGMLVTELNQHLQDNELLTENEQREELDRFIDYAFDDAEHGANIAKSPKYRKRATATCKLIMEEWAIWNRREEMTKGGTISIDPIAENEAFTDSLNIIRSISDVNLDVPFPEGWDKVDRPQLYTSGCSVLDDLYGGGWRQPECVLHMAPFGSGKTVLACHAMAELVVHCQTSYTNMLKSWEKRKLKTGKNLKKPKRPVVVLIFTEGAKHDYRVRLLAHMAQVPWKKLATMTGMEKLSKKGPGKGEDCEYEFKEFKEEIEKGESFHHEQERVRRAVKMFNKFMVMIDCTDSLDSTHQIGKGGIPEIANVVRMHFNRHKDTKPVGFWLDHISALVDRLAETLTDDQKLHLIIKRVPRQVVDRLCKPFKAPVALLHQLSGDANSRKMSARFHHSDAQGSKSVAEYVDFCTISGPVDKNQRTQLSVTKHRREPARDNKLVYINGEFQRIEDITAFANMDASGQTIVITGEDGAYTLNAQGDQIVTPTNKPTKHPGLVGGNVSLEE